MDDLLVRKRKTLFKCYDADENGFVTENDFIIIGERFVQAGNLSEEDAERCRENNQKASPIYLETYEACFILS